MKAPAVVKCLVKPKNITRTSDSFYSGSAHTVNITTPRKGTYRGAISRCEILTFGNDCKKYSYCLGSVPSLEEFFSENKTQSDLLLADEKEAKKYVDGSQGDKYKNPSNFYELENDNDEKVKVELFLGASESPKPTEHPKLPQDVKVKSSDTSLP